MLSISGDSVRHQGIVVSISNAAQTILNKNEILTYFNRQIGVFPMDRVFSDDSKNIINIDTITYSFKLSGLRTKNKIHRNHQIC